MAIGSGGLPRKFVMSARAVTLVDCEDDAGPNVVPAAVAANAVPCTTIRYRVGTSSVRRPCKAMLFISLLELEGRSRERAHVPTTLGAAEGRRWRTGAPG